MVPTDIGPFAMAVNPVTNKIYIANAFSNNVTVIDGATNNVITTITVGAEPWAFTWNPVQNRTYVANRMGSSISVIKDVTGINESAMSECLAPELSISPNPFSERTEIRYQMAEIQMQDFSLKIYDATGRLVKDFLLPTSHCSLPTSIIWDGTDHANRPLPSGMYFLKFDVKDDTEIRKLLLIR